MLTTILAVFLWHASCCEKWQCATSTKSAAFLMLSLSWIQTVGNHTTLAASFYPAIVGEDAEGNQQHTLLSQPLLWQNKKASCLDLVATVHGWIWHILHKFIDLIDLSHVFWFGLMMHGSKWDVTHFSCSSALVSFLWMIIHVCIMLSKVGATN